MICNVFLVVGVQRLQEALDQPVTEGERIERKTSALSFMT